MAKTSQTWKKPLKTGRNHLKLAKTHSKHINGVYKTALREY
jgi:hypothetical protein